MLQLSAVWLYFTLGKGDFPEVSNFPTEVLWWMSAGKCPPRERCSAGWGVWLPGPRMTFVRLPVVEASADPEVSQFLLYGVQGQEECLITSLSQYQKVV